jgi:ABC-type enterobactin transport system permease subunit
MMVNDAFAPAIIGDVAAVISGIAFRRRTTALADFVVSAALRAMTVTATAGGLPGAV